MRKRNTRMGGRGGVAAAFCALPAIARAESVAALSSASVYTVPLIAVLAAVGVILGVLLFKVIHGMIQRERRRRLRLEQTLKARTANAAELEVRYQMLFDASLHGVCQIAPASGEVRANAAVLALLGLDSTEQLVERGGLPAFAASHEAYAELELQLRKDSVTRADSFVLRRADGGELAVAVAAQVVSDPKGTPLYEEWHLLDLTERHKAEAAAETAAAEAAAVRREMEAQARQMLAQSFELAEARDRALQSAKAKSELLTSLGGDIRTPLNGIVGMSQLLQARLTGQHREFVDMMNRSAQMLLSSLDEILEYSKLESGQFEPSRDALSLRALVEQVAESLAGKAEAKGIEMPCLVRPDLPDALVGDATRLRQILYSIVDNAVRHTSSGEVSITVSLARRDGDEVYVRFQVEDSGTGISPQAFARLFEPTAQMDWSLNRSAESQGGRLRLAIAKLLIEKMGGQLGVDSEPGQGSLFWFLLPLTVQPAQTEQGGPDPSDILRGKRILVADDVISCRGVIAELTSAWGMRCVTASEGPQCLQLLDQAARGGEPFQFVMIDFDMPGMSGLELAETILERSQADRSYGSPYLIMTVPHSHRSWRDEPVLEGLRTVLSKPIRNSELQAALVQAVERSSDPAAGMALDLDELQRYLASDTNAEDPFKPAAPRVLIVEDNPVNQRVAARLVERMGYDADIVDNGQKALDALLTLNYALVLMDCQMPDMDGFTATAAIREQSSEVRNIPIVAMTASAMAGDRERCIAAGMNDYISKPVDAEVLRNVLQKWLTPAIV